MTDKLFDLKTQKIIVGTAPGSKKDARAVVDSFISRYCDLPSQVHYHMKKSSDGGFHFEIQEGPESGSVLDRILTHFKVSTSDLVISDSNRSQYRIFQRSDGTIRTFFLGEEEKVEADIDHDFETLIGKAYTLKPYQSKLTSLVVVSGLFFAASCLALIFAFMSWQSGQYVKQGLSQALAASPMRYMLASVPDRSSYASTPFKDLPINAGWPLVTQHMKLSREPIGRLFYQNGTWQISLRDQDPADVELDDGSGRTQIRKEDRP